MYVKPKSNLDTSLLYKPKKTDWNVVLQQDMLQILDLIEKGPLNYDLTDINQFLKDIKKI